MKSNLLLLCGIFSMAAPAFGSLVFQLSPAILSSSPGATPLVFYGTLTDTDNDNSFLFLNDIRVTFTAPGASFLSIDPTGQPATSPNTFFFNTVPGTLLADTDPVNNSYSGPVFEIFIAPNTPYASYFGTIEILGGFNDPTETNVLATRTFQVNVVAPEPAALVLCFAGLGALSLIRRTRSAAA